MQAAIVGDFTGGTGTSQVDQYTRTAGSGWAGAWGVNISNGSFTSATVISANPLGTGTGNYFAGTFTARSDASAQRRGWIRRDYNSSGEVDVTATHQVSFRFRLDSSLDAFTGAQDYIAIYDHPTNNTDTSAASTWMIRAHATTQGSAPTMKWVFYNGNPTSTALATSRWVSSGLDLIAGNIYEFTITTDPAAKTYQANLKNLTTPAEYTSNSLNYRSYFDNPTSAGTVLHFGGSVSDNSETLSFSLDNISIVPEPAAAALAVPAGLLLARRRGRRA